MLPSTAQRVTLNTSRRANERIRQKTQENIARYAKAGPRAINRRLAELDREWDIERTLEANAASVSLIGLALGAFVHRRLLFLPAVVGGFLLQHAIQGWCPPVPILRRLGFRTQTEIDQERYALKALRGDFERLGKGHGRSNGRRMHQAIEAVRS